MANIRVEYFHRVLPCFTVFHRVFGVFAGVFGVFAGESAHIFPDHGSRGGWPTAVHPGNIFFRDRIFFTAIYFDLL